jgi:hypothetical protein
LNVPLQQGEDFLQLCLIFFDKALLEDASSPFSGTKSSTAKE